MRRIADVEAADVEVDRGRNLERESLDVELRDALREHATLGCADSLAHHVERHRRVDRLVEPHLLKVDVRDRPAHAVELVLLEHRGMRVAGLDDDVEHGVRAGAAGQRRPQVPLGDRDRDRRLAAVQDAGDQTLVAQPARLGGAEDRPVLDQKLHALSRHGAEV